MISVHVYRSDWDSTLHSVAEHHVLFGQLQQHRVIEELVDTHIFTQALEIHKSLLEISKWVKGGKCRVCYSLDVCQLLAYNRFQCFKQFMTDKEFTCLYLSIPYQPTLDKNSIKNILLQQYIDKTNSLFKVIIKNNS